MDGERYYSLGEYLKNTYDGKVKKIALDAGFSCPNRDGKIDTRGCIFCSVGGSGDFAIRPEALCLEIERFEKEAAEKNQQYAGYIGYFQAFTNTYGSIEHLDELYSSVLGTDKVLGISIGTRPDCVDTQVVELLKRLKSEFPDKFIWIELGLQTIHEKTAEYIRRGYELKIFDQVCDSLKEAGIPYIVHMIFGLPGEDKDMMLETVSYVKEKNPFGVKLQLLHVLKGTDLATDYELGLFQTLTLEEYTDIVCDALKIIGNDIVVHRITGDGNKAELIAPLWSAKKGYVLNYMRHEMKIRKL